MIGIDIGSYYVKICKILKRNSKEISIYSLLQNVYNMEYKQKQIVLKNLLDKINPGRDYAFLAEDIHNEMFVENAIMFLEKFNVVEKPTIIQQIEII